MRKLEEEEREKTLEMSDPSNELSEMIDRSIPHYGGPPPPYIVREVGYRMETLVWAEGQGSNFTSCPSLVHEHLRTLFTWPPVR